MTTMMMEARSFGGALWQVGEPMSVGRWLGEMWRVWLASWVNLMMISVFFCVGAGLLLSFAWGSAPLVALALMVVTLSSVMIWGAMHALAHEDARSGASSSMGPAFKACWERYDVVLLAMVFYGGIMGIAGIFVLPALLAGGMLLPFMPVVLQEKRSPLGGLMRTTELIEGKWLKLAMCWLVLQAVMMGVALMGGAVVGASSLLGVSTEWGGGLASGSIGVTLMVGMAVAVVVFPLPAVGAVATYRLLRQEEIATDTPERREERRARRRAEKTALIWSGWAVDDIDCDLESVYEEDEAEMARAMKGVEGQGGEEGVDVNKEW